MFIKAEIAVANTDFRYPMTNLATTAASGIRLLEEERQKILEPQPRKESPVWSVRHLSEAIGLTSVKIGNLISHDPNNKYPHGTSQGQGRSREFSIDDVYKWMSIVNPPSPRPEGKRGRIIAVTNLKGGSAKSSTVVPLAQALALTHGRTCCIVDIDPQGTSTQLLGWASDIEIDFEHTVGPVLFQDTTSLLPVVRETYWKNVSCIPACTNLLDVEFHISNSLKEPDSINANWQGLKSALVELADHFDVIIIDSPPSFSHITMSAIMASDALVVPMQPSPLDFAATAKYFLLMADIFAHVPAVYAKKVFDYVSILITRDKKSPITDYVTDWIRRAYGSMVLPMTIPDSRAVETAYAAFGTVYDHPKPTGTPEAHYRYKKPFDEFVSYVNSQLVEAWGRK